jgi:hypothetical protein
MQSKTRVSDGVEEADWLLEGILHESQQRGIYVSRTFHLKGPRSFASFATKSIALRELLLECAPNLTPVQRVRLGQVCARELANYLGQVSFDRMMNRIDLIPEALQEAFPGYCASKLLGLVVAYGE